ncbi:MAG: hypothetical protein AAF942_07975 [Pseudomonadota bacterium]
MNGLPWQQEDPDVIRPSLLYNGFLAGGCLILAVAMFGAEAGSYDSALFMVLFLLFSAGVLLASHLPGSTGVWLDDDGFETRELYKSERFRWADVGPFTVRRRLLGTMVEFALIDPDAKLPEAKQLPRGLGRSAWKLMRLMNERRDRALGTEN